MVSADADGAPHRLVGRSDELARISAFLSRLTGDGGALVLTGDPGTGKTALVDAAAVAARDRGIDVVRCVGTEFEAQIGFASLHQLLHRFVGRIDDLAAPYRAALSVAFGFADGAPVNPLVLSTASLALVGLGCGGPALVIVDDIQWVDPASADVLAVMIRRTGGTRVGILIARRTGTAELVDQERVAELRVETLDPDGSVELLRREHGALDPGVVQRVLDAAGGNPLALVELPGVLADGEGPNDPAAPVPLTARLQRAFSVQVADLPPACRRLLLLAVLDGRGDLALLRRAAGPDGRLDDLEPAARCGLITITIDSDAGALHFRHPLTGAAVVELASSDERRAAHRTIAELTDDPDRRAWHSASAADGPDDDVASAMERAGDRWMRRGDSAGALRAFVRAGRLSSSPQERARRLSMAASHAALRTSHFRESSDLLVEAIAADPTRRGSLNDASAAAFLLVNSDGDIDAAYRLLAAAASDVSVASTSTPQLDNYLVALAVISSLAERPEWWQRVHDLVALMGLPPGSWFRVADCLNADPAHRGREAIVHLDAKLATIGLDRSPDDALNAAISSLWVDRLGACHSSLLSAWERADGEMTSLSALMYLCIAEQQMGEWAAADRHASAGIHRSGETSASIFTWQFQLIAGLVAAGQGELGRAVALADEVERWVRPRGIRLGLSGAQHIRTLLAWAEGDPTAAFQHAAAISPPGTLRSHAPRALFVALDLVEAAVRTGRRHEAVAHVAALRAADVQHLSPRLAMVQFACEGWISDGSDAITQFESAIAVEGADRSPFDFARVHLALGEALRRRRAETTLARDHLREAVSVFRSLGAAPWVHRAEAEIRATGESRAHDRRQATLTAQELHIARLAATGMRNKEIGTELFLSPRTVSAHLYRIFPKLGITSRAALRDALSALDDAHDP